MKRRVVRRWPLVGVAVLGLIAAACGSSKGGTSTATTAAGGNTSTTASSGGGGGSSGCSSPDTSIDAQQGQYAGWTQAVLACTASKPIKATGSPIVVGFINPQGDPNGSFPDATAGAQAAVDYINNDLGGIGGDPLKGVAGHPIQLSTCFETIAPSSSSSCANQIAGAHPLFVVSGFQFFGEVADPVFKGAGIPVINYSPITLADFNSQGVFDVSSGGGCVGVHPALIAYSVYGLHGKNLAIPWSNTPPGVVCYYDLEQKPVQIINGSLTPTPANVQVVQGVVEHGYPIPPAAPDDSAVAAQILAQKPDVIIYSAQASDCFNLLNSLSTAGWSAQKIPLVLSGACSDTKQIAQAGAKADGVDFIGAAYNLLDASSASGLASQEISIGLAKSKQYSPSQSLTGVEEAMFQTWLSTWIVLQNSSSAANLTASSIDSTLAATDNVHLWAGNPWGCKSAPQGYNSVCATVVSVQQWNGTKFVQVNNPVPGSNGPNFNAAYIVSGTPIHATGSG